MESKKPIAIIGVGNSLMADEGIGPHAIKYLEQFDWPDDIELIDAAVPGPSLLHMIEGRQVTIIIDCADFKGKPGDIIVVTEDQIVKSGKELLSLHGTTLSETLALANATNAKVGNVFIICVQPMKIEMSTDLSDEIAAILPNIRRELSKILGSNLEIHA